MDKSENSEERELSAESAGSENHEGFVPATFQRQENVNKLLTKKVIFSE